MNRRFAFALAGSLTIALGACARKPAPGAHTRNAWGPQSDKLAIGCPFSETADSEVANRSLVRAVGYDTGPGTTFSCPTYYGTANRTGFHDGEHNAVFLGPSGYITLLDNTRGTDDLVLYRGTCALRFKATALTAVAIMQAGVPTGVGFSIGIDPAHHESISLQQGTITRTATVSDVTADFHTCVFTWGEAGGAFYVDGAQVGDAFTCSLITIPHGASGARFRIGAATEASPAGFSNPVVSMFGLWDWQLSGRELNEIWADPRIPFRPMADTNAFFTPVGPIVTRPTTGGATWSVVTGTDAACASSCGFAVDLYRDANCTTPLTGVTWTPPTAITSTGNTRLLLASSATLPAGTATYWRSRYTTDNGSTWAYFPIGVGRIKEPPASSNGYTVAVIADDHAGGAWKGTLDCRGHGALLTPDNNMFYGLDIERQSAAGGGLYPGTDASGEGYKDMVHLQASLFRTWAVMRDLRDRDIDFVVFLGDGPFGQSSGANEDSTRLWRKWWSPIYKVAPVFFVVGNHEGEGGCLQAHGTAQSDGPTQMRATCARKRYLPMPTDTTYPLGGEREGDPAEPTDHDYYHPRRDWLPALAPEQKPLAYFRRYIYEYPTAPTHAARLGLNTSPLENYYGWSWGPCSWFALDLYRYTEPGVEHNSSSLYSVWQLGNSQRAWLRAASSPTSDSTRHKVALLHHMPGGTGRSGGRWYGRGSGIQADVARAAHWPNGPWDSNASGGLRLNPGIAEETWLQQLMQSRRMICLKGHDHQWGVATSNDIPIVTIGAPRGFKFTTLATTSISAEDVTSYGDNRVLGRDVPGVSFAASAPGYALVDVTTAGLTCRFRQTSLPTGKAFGSVAWQGTGPGGRPHTAELNWEVARWAGPVVAQATEANRLTLPETPSSVWMITSNGNAVFPTGEPKYVDTCGWLADVATNGALNIGSNSWKVTTGHGDYQRCARWYEEPWGNAVVHTDTGDTIGTNGAQVIYVPRTIYSVTIGQPGD